MPSPEPKGHRQVRNPGLPASKACPRNPVQRPTDIHKHTMALLFPIHFQKHISWVYSQGRLQRQQGRGRRGPSVQRREGGWWWRGCRLTQAVEDLALHAVLDLARRSMSCRTLWMACSGYFCGTRGGVSGIPPDSPLFGSPGTPCSWERSSLQPTTLHPKWAHPS